MTFRETDLLPKDRVGLSYQLFKSVEVVTAIITAAILVTTKQFVGNRCGAEIQYKNFKKERRKTT
jgi:hypothetical protein